LIYLTLGTDAYPFTRAIDAVFSLDLGGEQLIVQGGTTPRPDVLPEGVIWHEWVEFDQTRQLTIDADVVICHAGIGSVMLAFDVGRSPVIFPRLKEFGEHVDSHQLEIAEQLAGLGLVHYAATFDQLEAEISKARALGRGGAVGDGASLRRAVMDAIGHRKA
jgi:UDP-N-acetylglucosamine--N-acetylmuramyl-(pentapeptide) pyrophosphoryl-undecaprenol N-acetylglucosamine transferase